MEVRLDDTPLEAGLMFTCKLKTDTDFQGRAALEQRKAGGVRRKKVCFTVDDPDVCLVGLEGIVRDGQYVGHIRRGDTGYYLDTEMAYGYVSHPRGDKVTNAWLLEGDYHLESRGQLYKADIHMKTPFDAANNRCVLLSTVQMGLENTKIFLGYKVTMTVTKASSPDNNRSSWITKIWWAEPQLDTFTHLTFNSGIPVSL